MEGENNISTFYVSINVKDNYPYFTKYNAHQMKKEGELSNEKMLFTEMEGVME